MIITPFFLFYLQYINNMFSWKENKGKQFHSFVGDKLREEKKKGIVFLWSTIFPLSQIGREQER